MYTHSSGKCRPKELRTEKLSTQKMHPPSCGAASQSLFFVACAFERVVEPLDPRVTQTCSLLGKYCAGSNVGFEVRQPKKLSWTRKLSCFVLATLMRALPEPRQHHQSNCASAPARHASSAPDFQISGMFCRPADAVSRPRCRANLKPGLHARSLTLQLGGRCV